MKHYLSLIIFLFLTFDNNAQSDSIFSNLKSLSIDICTHAWDFEGLNQFEHLTVYSDDPMTDTLRVMDQNGVDFASLWLDGRKTWLKIDSTQTSSIDGFVFYHYSNFYEDYPLDEFFLLYDFDVLDTASIGDTVFFEDSPFNVPIYISGIDTILINGVEKTRYEIITFVEYRDYLIEGVGGTHPFTTLLNTGWFGACKCGYEATYMSETDTLVLSDTMMFGGDSNWQFCRTANVLSYEKSNEINIYPNPVTDNKFNIQVDLNTKIHQVNLYDNQGKKMEIDYVISNTASHYSVLTNELSSGLYIVEIVTDSSYTRKKIIIK